MRHLLGLVILLLLVGLAGVRLRRYTADRHRRRRTMARGLKIGIPTENGDEPPEERKEQ